MTTKTNLPAKIELPAEPIAEIGQLRSTYDRVSKQANLIMPVSHCDFIPPMMRVSLRAVIIDPDGRDVYKPKFCKQNERAPGKTMILRLLQAAGGDVRESERTDDEREQYVASWRVKIRVPQLDGTSQEFIGSKRVDYRDGSAQISTFTPNQISQARQFIPELAETKALLRAVRGALALSQEYTLEELAKPFVVPALVPDLDVSDPEIRRMMARKILQLNESVYPQAPATGTPTVLLPSGDNRPEPSPPDDPEESLDGLEAPPEPESVAPPTTPEGICTCPCGCQQAISTELSDYTKEKLGTERCRACYPYNADFALAKHFDVKDFEIPRLPKFNILDAKRWAESQKK